MAKKKNSIRRKGRSAKRYTNWGVGNPGNLNISKKG